MKKKPFKDSEVKNILKKHKEILKQLQIAALYSDARKKDIKDNAYKLLSKEVLLILSDISVDEILKRKKGLRVKVLKDSGYDTLDKVFSARPYQLFEIYGISEDAAYQIKKIVNEYANEIASSTKIKISIDDKNIDNTKLISSIFKYKMSLNVSDKCREILSSTGRSINNAISNIEHSKGIMRWFLMSDNNKQTAIDSYDYLIQNIDGAYFEEAKKLCGYIDKIENVKDDYCWKDFEKDSVNYFSILEKINPGFFGNNDDRYGLPEDLATKIQDECFFPDGLLCTLRNYQEWGVKYILHQERVLLGDEMGLGKTIQAIATMVSLKNTGATHFLVVCPLSVSTNWCREIKKHSLLSVIKIHGNDKKKKIENWINSGGVAVTTYETTSAFELDEMFRFSMLIVDEAHYIKNENAQRTKNVLAVSKHTDRILYMTGTPLENKVDEMVKLLYDLNPEVANRAKAISFMSNAEQFRKVIAPVYYRRKREDVLTELPELIENEEWCTMLEEEERIYEDCVLDGKYVPLRRVSWNIDDLSMSSKAIRLKEIVEEATLDERKIIVFSFFLDTIRKVKELLGDRCLEPINGSVSAKRRQEILDEFDNAKPGTVLVSQIISGGTGLNIQTGSVVIICEPQEKPSIENQAIARAYRMGQTRNVLVYRLLCENSIDEKIFNRLKEKQLLFDKYADISVAAMENMDLDNKAINELIKEEIDRINKKRGIDPSTKRRNNPNKEYYEKIANYSYKQLVDSLLKKYGPSEHDYFLTEECKNKNKKVSRSAEGLVCHHIDEDKAIMLSTSEFASKCPFEYQKANRLVYCNYLEHLLLHIKIAEESNTDKDYMLYGIGGAVIITKHLNTFYTGTISSEEYLNIASKLVIEDYDSYILYLNVLWQLIKKNNIYSREFTIETLAQDWNGNVIKEILDDIKD